ncbi:MAG: hypothetical protein AMXMBFR57_11350 [Acidimicrobiia bacterium]|jgi:hypothetical protein
MASSLNALKQALRDEVAALAANDGAIWKQPILRVLDTLRRSNIEAVLFGGTLRSLLAARLFEGRRGRPRDIDLVVSGAAVDDLEERFRKSLDRRTRFGGVRLREGQWQFDVWPVGDTWAFRHDLGGHASFAGLPGTTSFNLEAVAVEVWPTDHRSRALFSGDDQFFDGILSRTLELNRTTSPFPELTVVRGLVMASELRFRIGPRFADHVRAFGSALGEEQLVTIQASHYGFSRLEGRTIKLLIDEVNRRPAGQSITLPVVGQLPLPLSNIGGSPSASH